MDDQSYDSDALYHAAVRATVLMSQSNRGSGKLNAGLRYWYRQSQRARDATERKVTAYVAAAKAKAKAKKD